jgi:thiamine transport system permease protein
VTPLGAVLNSLLFATIASIITVPISVIAAYLIDSRPFPGKRALDTIVLFPIGASAVALGYGLATGGFTRGMAGTWTIIALVHTLLAYPFCARSVLTSKRSMDPERSKAAQLLGSSRVRTWMDIELPQLMPGIAVAAIFAFAISLGEFGATNMVHSPEYTTMPVALFGFISGQERGIGPTSAYAVILMSAAAISFVILDRIVKGGFHWSSR